MTQLDETADASDLYCPSCGYNLRQIESSRCPECGMEVDRSKVGESIIPWIHRARIGRYRAFWRPCQMATLRPRDFTREMTQPARLKDAVTFRRLVVLHALLPLGVG